MQIFIILPAFDLNSPIKGAVAIANYLCKYYSTNIIFLKGIKKDYQLELDKMINVYCFAG